jgi:beta-galactosidase GanA
MMELSAVDLLKVVPFQAGQVKLLSHKCSGELIMELESLSLYAPRPVMADRSIFASFLSALDSTTLRGFVSTALAAVLVLSTTTTFAQAKEQPIPRIVKKDGRYALFVDDAPYFILGAQVNNSSGWPEMLPKVWPAIEFMHANTVEIPVYWEQFEPRPGRFDYSVVDTLLAQAREHQLHLVLLWFATWKNGSQHYMPEWMKLDPERYAHVIDEQGRALDSPSPFAAASLEEDTRAFATLMSHLKTADPQRTVLMVQVENEPGTGGNMRDHSPIAQKLFDGPVPADVLKAMHVQMSGPSPNWKEAFGPDAEVCFHNWAVAKYIGQVAAAGKAAYPLPLYVNAAPGTQRGAALRDPARPGGTASYKDGGPSGNIIPIWKVAAPALDMISPDDYATDATGYVKMLDVYQRDDNPLFVPETGGSPRFFFFALGHQTIGWSPFGMDFTRIHTIPDAARPGDEVLPPWARTGTKEFVAPFAPAYQLIHPMAREIARLNFEGKLQAVAEEQDKVTQTLSFGAWDAVVSYGVWSRYGHPTGNPQPMGGALVAQLKDNQFLVAGFHCRVDFQTITPDKHRQFLRVEEGIYENGSFKFVRLLNGDQTDGGLDFSSEPLVLRVSVATY